MRAGSLREFLEFRELRKTQSPSGAIKQEWIAVYECRAMVKKSSPVYDKNGVDAKELYKGSTIFFVVRAHKRIKDTQRVFYNGRLYEIILTEPNRADNTLTVQVRRLNE